MDLPLPAGRCNGRGIPSKQKYSNKNKKAEGEEGKLTD